MKNNIIRKKSIILLIIVMLILALTIKTYATDELNNNENANTNTETENQAENQNENQSQNQNENPTNNENENNENNNEEPTPPPSPIDNSNKNTNSNNNNNTQTEQVNKQEQNNNQQQNNEPLPIIETEEEKSSNTYLRSITVDAEGLTPEFQRDILEYYLIVDLNIEEIEINAVPEDTKSTVIVRGNKDLIEGENTVDIIVRAENGTSKTYKIYVTRTKDLVYSNANLKSLSIKNFDYYPEFKPTIYNYNLLLNEKIDKLEILAETEVEEATFEITGNENLVEGDNLIKVIVTAQNGETKREYKINVFISTINVEPQKMNTKQAYILIAFIGIAIITIGALAIKYRK